MGNARFSGDFKQDAVHQITVRGYPVTDRALQALLMAVWRRKPADRVLIHSDQGSQFTSLE